MDRRPLGPFLVSPIGFGAMRLTGPNVFGPPKDRGDALVVLREAVHQGVDHIDTAQYYGPNVVNELIREALHPYPAELILVSKVGARRDRDGGVLTDDEPRQLRRAIEENLRTLGVEALPIVNLRLMRARGMHPAEDRVRAVRTAGLRPVGPELGPRQARSSPGSGAIGHHTGAGWPGLGPDRVPERLAYPGHILPAAFAREPGGSNGTP